MFQLIAAHSPACRTDDLWIVEHENNNEHILLLLLTELSLVHYHFQSTETTDGYIYIRNSD